ncbi:DUF1311 domain-containing protein [Herbaspirillum frisingense]|uniref:lysozyme inhibitor LprI family protein n=1 Tax=Herbaspirillum frisingense TaxID=92645 RepID=UPI001603B1E6|nr:lysozyme inhibitor LprI family protein [Herbaspirillum frisingense]QNB08629.1 DUF1311 domain-containing protein [Herbaspirillum frisingense]
MYMHAVITVGFFLLAVEASAIECARVGNFAEETICGDPTLLRLDNALNNNYRWTLNSDIGDGAKKALKRSQKTWLLRRNQCPDRECMMSLYKQRIEEICDYPVISGVHPTCDESDTTAETDPRD